LRSAHKIPPPPYTKIMTIVRADIMKGDMFMKS